MEGPLELPGDGLVCLYELLMEVPIRTSLLSSLAIVYPLDFARTRLGADIGKTAAQREYKVGRRQESKVEVTFSFSRDWWTVSSRASRLTV